MSDKDIKYMSDGLRIALDLLTEEQFLEYQRIRREEFVAQHQERVKAT